MSVPVDQPWWHLCPNNLLRRKSKTGRKRLRERWGRSVAWKTFCEASRGCTGKKCPTPRLSASQSLASRYRLWLKLKANRTKRTWQWSTKRFRRCPSATVFVWRQLPFDRSSVQAYLRTRVSVHRARGLTSLLCSALMTDFCQIAKLFPARRVQRGSAATARWPTSLGSHHRCSFRNREPAVRTSALESKGTGRGLSTPSPVARFWSRALRSGLPCPCNNSNPAPPMPG